MSTTEQIDRATTKTGRWSIRRLRWTTWAVMAFGTIWFVLLNVPGDQQVAPYDLTLDGAECWHGWPLTYLKQDLADGAWNLSALPGELRADSLLADVVIAIGAVGLAAAVWQWLPRRTRPWWQFSLWQVFAIVTACAILVGIWAVGVRREDEISRCYREAGPSSGDVDGWVGRSDLFVPAFPDWVRDWLEDETLLRLRWNRIDPTAPAIVDVTDTNVASVAQLLELLPEQVLVCLDCEANPSPEKLLDSLRNVRRLNCIHPTSRIVSKIATLPHLRELFVKGTHDSDESWSDGLRAVAHCQELRILSLESLIITRAMWRAWHGLQKLESLDAVDCAFPDGGFDELLPLPELRNVSLSNSYYGGAQHRVFVALPKCDLRGLGASPHLTALRFTSLAADDRWLAELPPLPELRTLDVESPGITDEGLGQFHKFPELRELWLRRARIRGPGLSQLTTLRHLRHVWIDSPITRLKDFHPSELPRLVDLNLLRVRSSQTEFQEFSSQAPMAMCDRWQPADGLESFVEVPADAAPWAEQVKGMTLVDLECAPLADEEFTFLKGAELVEILNLSGSGLGNGGLSYVTAPPKLTQLKIERTWVTARGLAALQACPSLETLTLDVSLLDEQGLQNLSRIVTLRELEVITEGRPTISREQARQIQSKLPRVKVHFDNAPEEATEP